MGRKHSLVCFFLILIQSALVDKRKLRFFSFPISLLPSHFFPLFHHFILNCFQLRRKKRSDFHFPNVHRLKEYLHCSIFLSSVPGFHFSWSSGDAWLLSTFYSSYFLAIVQQLFLGDSCSDIVKMLSVTENFKWCSFSRKYVYWQLFFLKELHLWKMTNLPFIPGKGVQGGKEFAFSRNLLCAKLSVPFYWLIQLEPHFSSRKLAVFFHVYL